MAAVAGTNVPIPAHIVRNMSAVFFALQGSQKGCKVLESYINCLRRNSHEPQISGSLAGKLEVAGFSPQTDETSQMMHRVALLAINVEQGDRGKKTAIWTEPRGEDLFLIKV